MQWGRGSRQSSNIEDQRGGGGGGFGGPAMRVGGAGGVGILVLALVAMFFGVDPSVILNGGFGPQDQGTDASYQPDTGGGTVGSPQEEERKKFVAYVLGSTEDTWKDVLGQAGRQYEDPKLVLFSGGVNSACGFAQTASGPFYCPADQKVYLDLSFFDELAQRFKAPGDFAQAYVIAHEVGHHVQTLLGITQKVQAYRQRASKEEANQISVMTELQADCFAGVWASHADAAHHILEQGDVEEGLQAASAVGDDRIQKRTQGYVVPESFTHGSAQQRSRWFKAGLQSGDINACDTFSAAQL